MSYLLLILSVIFCQTAQNEFITGIDKVENFIYGYWYIVVPVILLLLGLAIYIRNRRIEEEEL